MSRPPSSQHRDLLTGAKQQQAEHLQNAAAASAQLVRAVDAIIKINSTSSSSCPVLLDKISTIHELDREIDRQLNHDIVSNYEELLDAKRRLARHVQRIQRALAITADSEGSYVDLLQRRVEVMDQELRILENTLAIVKANKRLI